MSKVSFIEVDGKEYAIIDRGNEEFTSMPKADYEEMIDRQAEQSTPIVVNEATTI
jgi:PHD/YefM family antitoxin component YafN of YafNO toxin-antitoxin module